MLNLKLRDEFLGSQMPGTAITLRSADQSGAAQKGAQDILEITYPTADVQAALRQISKERKARPIVLMGDRGRGKSHIMAVLHHAIESPDVVEPWAQSWGNELGVAAFAGIALERGFAAISEPVHNHEYPLLWNLLFDRHPDGQYYRGKFEQMSQPYPPRSLLEEMFQKQPTALILDEFQKWFDGLHDDTGADGKKLYTWASNFIQNLSEIAVDHPDRLILVISVLNSDTEAFQQVHRNSPVVIDFRGPTAKQDRKRMVLHRLFENRGNIPPQDVASLISPYAAERFRLRFPHLTQAERNDKDADVAQAWPFAPELIDLLEDHILMAQAAQEARDLIRILAEVFRTRGESVPVITPADFLVDDDACGVQSLLTSIASTGQQEKLREIAQANLDLITASGENVPHARELVSSLWMRSMAPGKDVGGTWPELQLDITRDQPISDNAFEAEIVRLIDSSKNIHGEQSAEKRLRFELKENPRSLVRATAKNDKLWQPSADSAHPGQSTYPLQDIEHIRSTLRHLLVSETAQPASRIIVLGPNWKTDPWSDVAEGDQPQNWDRPILLAVPSPLDHQDDKISELGEWLKQHVPKRRNTIRFLILKQGAKGLYDDAELRFLARCSYLTSQAWKDDSKYANLKRDFDNPFRTELKSRFDRFAFLLKWDYPNPQNCAFEVERIEAQGSDVPQKVEAKLLSLFEPNDFTKKVLAFAQQSNTVGKLLDELADRRGPRLAPPTKPPLPRPSSPARPAPPTCSPLSHRLPPAYADVLLCRNLRDIAPVLGSVPRPHDVPDPGLSPLASRGFRGASERVFRRQRSRHSDPSAAPPPLGARRRQPSAVVLPHAAGAASLQIRYGHS